MKEAARLGGSGESDNVWNQSPLRSALWDDDWGRGIVGLAMRQIGH